MKEVREKIAVLKKELRVLKKQKLDTNEKLHENLRQVTIKEAKIETLEWVLETIKEQGEARGRKKGDHSSAESFIIARGAPGVTFYSEKEDRHLTAIATNHKRKIKTQRTIALHADMSPEKKIDSRYITKVILL